MAVGGLFVIALLGVIVVAVVFGLQRVLNKRTSEASDGNDVVAYVILALAVGVAGFALARLAETAFPSGGLIVDPVSDLASSLPALIVALPFVVFFWRRQAERREIYPKSDGWAVYLALIELFFGIAFVVSAVLFWNGLFGPDTAAWTGAVVFGMIMVLHELATRRTPASSDAGELYRVIGSAIGLVTMTIGLTLGLGAGVFTTIQDAIAPDPALDIMWLPFVPMAIVGAPIWLYRWFRPWGTDPGLARLTWMVVVSIGAFWMLASGVTGTFVLLAQDLFAGQGTGGRFPQFLGVFLALAIVGFGVWLVHRKALGASRNNVVRAYESGLAATSLISAVTTGVALTVMAFMDGALVGGDSSDVIEIGFSLVASLGVWLWFHSRSATGQPEEEATAWPRRLYLLGIGAVMGIASAIGLIITLVVIIRRVLEDASGDSLLIPATVFVYTGLAAWYLLILHSRGQRYSEDKEVVTPFTVTIVCSHPGPISTMFGERARLRVIYRGDSSGVITEEMAADIVSSVGHESSLVWVDGDGARVAPARVN